MWHLPYNRQQGKQSYRYKTTREGALPQLYIALFEQRAFSSLHLVMFCLRFSVAQDDLVLSCTHNYYTSAWTNHWMAIVFELMEWKTLINGLGCVYTMNTWANYPVLLCAYLPTPHRNHSGSQSRGISWPVSTIAWSKFTTVR